MLSAANDPLAARTRVLDAGRVMLAADTLGAAQSMFDQAVAFAKERVQFGRVIGSFQGVKHTLADLVTALEPCRALVWFAAHAQDALPDEARLAALQAKAHLDDVGREVARLVDRGARRHGLHGPAGPALLVEAHRLQPPAARHARAVPPRGGSRAGLGPELIGRHGLCRKPVPQRGNRHAAGCGPPVIPPRRRSPNIARMEAIHVDDPPDQRPSRSKAR